jgi:molybdate transport system ATP-binding protein
VLHAEARTRFGSFELDIDVNAESGRCLAIAGPSGAGKTTLLRIVAGLLTPDSGLVSCGSEVWLDTEAGVNIPPERRRCGYLFQDYALFPHMNAWRNVAYPLRDIPRSERRSRAEELLERFGVGQHAEAHPGDLSGGERQRVALARALALRPRALLLDEPLSALDVRTRAQASRELGDALRASGVPALLVTHDFAEAALLSDEIGVIDQGRLVQVGSAAELAASPKSAFVADFTGAVVLTGSAAPAEDGLTRVELDGGGSVTSTDAASGRVSVTVYPWEISLEPPGEVATSSARNHLSAEVVSLTTIGNRVRVGLATSQPLIAEITTAALEALALKPGAPVTATWKAAATRLIAA